MTPAAEPAKAILVGIAPESVVDVPVADDKSFVASATRTPNEVVTAVMLAPLEMAVVV